MFGMVGEAAAAVGLGCLYLIGTGLSDKATKQKGPERLRGASKMGRE